MINLLIALAMLAVSAPALAGDPPNSGTGKLSLSTGFDFSSGKYGGTNSTDILYIPVTGKYETDKLTLKLTVPYIKITGPGGVTYGIGPLGQTTATPIITTDSGLGDVIAAVGYNIYDVDSLAFDLVGKIKFGTADAKTGLGTGKTDYSAQIDGDYIRDKTKFFATIGYKVYGSPADGVTLHNVPYGTIGANHKLGDQVRVGALLYLKQSPSIFSGQQREVTIYVSKKLSDTFKVQVNASRGYARGSPDFGFGAMITNIF